MDRKYIEIKPEFTDSVLLDQRPDSHADAKYREDKSTPIVSDKTFSSERNGTVNTQGIVPDSRGLCTVMATTDSKCEPVIVKLEDTNLYDPVADPMLDDKNQVNLTMQMKSDCLIPDQIRISDADCKLDPMISLPYQDNISIEEYRDHQHVKSEVTVPEYLTCASLIKSERRSSVDMNSGTFAADKLPLKSESKEIVIQPCSVRLIRVSDNEVLNSSIMSTPNDLQEIKPGYRKSVINSTTNRDIVTESGVRTSSDVPQISSNWGAGFARRYLKLQRQQLPGDAPTKEIVSADDSQTAQKAHTGSKPFACDECEKTFSHDRSLRRHQRIHTEGKPFSCSQCGGKFTRLENLKRHQQIHTRDNRLCCENPSLSDYNVRGPFYCADCNKPFSHKHSLQRHQIVHREGKRFSCTECGKRFTRRENLERHHELHTAGKLFLQQNLTKSESSTVLSSDMGAPYSGWGAEFNIRYGADWKGRQKVPTDETGFSCDECDKKFVHIRSLRRHQHSHLGKDRKLPSCNECGKNFTRPENLKQHQIRHTGQKPFSCDVCAKRFYSVKNLRSHKLLHSGIKRFSCEECGRGFRHRSAMIAHKIVHTGEKPYACGECGKKFARGYYLKIHEKVHSDESPYWCAECGKWFRSMSTLRKHRVLHTGYRPYACVECGKRFVRRYALRQHQMVHGGQTHYACDVCGKSFSSCSDLESHQLSHTAVKSH